MKKVSEQVIFIHIPKCAGSSFRAYLNNLADNVGLPIKERYIPGENGLPHNTNLDQLNSEQSQRFYNSSVSLIAMHALYGLHQEFPHYTSPVYLTFLREPLSRFISHYNHFQYRLGQDNCKGIPLAELDKDKAESVISKLSNLMCRYIAGKKWKNLNNTDLSAQAMDNLFLRFSAFGIVEDIESSIKSIQSVLPAWLCELTKGEFPEFNKGVCQNTEYPDWLESLFKTYNESDIRLYNAALENKESLRDLI